MLSQDNVEYKAIVTFENKKKYYWFESKYNDRGYHAETAENPHPHPLVKFRKKREGTYWATDDLRQNLLKNQENDTFCWILVKNYTYSGHKGVGGDLVRDRRPRAISNQNWGDSVEGST